MSNIVIVSDEAAVYRALERCFAPTPAEAKADKHLRLDVPGYPLRIFEMAVEGGGKGISLRMRQAPFALFDYERAKNDGR